MAFPSPRRLLRPFPVCLCPLLLMLAGSTGQAQSTLALSPAVIRASGTFGQSLTQKLTISNETPNVFAFQMIAEDVVVQDGKRAFLPAGKEPGSIAATAVFSPQQIVAPPHSKESVNVTITIPPKTAIRAIVAVFHATSAVNPKAGSVGLLASMGTLITFNLSNDTAVTGDPVEVHLPTSATNLSFDETLTNTGTEPVLPNGIAAILNDKRKLAGKVPFTVKRLLPGEKLDFHAEYSDQLKPGHYTVLCTFQYAGHVATEQAEFTIQ